MTGCIPAAESKCNPRETQQISRTSVPSGSRCLVFARFFAQCVENSSRNDLGGGTSAAGAGHRNHGEGLCTIRPIARNSTWLDFVAVVTPLR